MTIDEWVKERQIKGHDVVTIILDRTTGEGILTTLDPVTMAALQHAEGAATIKLKEH